MKTLMMYVLFWMFLHLFGALPYGWVTYGTVAVVILINLIQNLIEAKQDDLKDGTQNAGIDTEKRQTPTVLTVAQFLRSRPGDYGTHGTRHALG